MFNQSYGVHITPLVINSLGADTHTHTHKHTYRRLHRNNFKKPGVRWPAAGTPGLINALTVTLVGHSLNYHTSVNCKEMQNQTEQVQHTKHNCGAIFCKFCEQNILHIFNAVTYKCHKAGINTHVSLHKLP